MRLLRFSGYAIVSNDNVNVLDGRAVKEVFQYHTEQSEILEMKDTAMLLDNPNVDLDVLEKYFIAKDNSNNLDNSRIVIGGQYKHFKGKTVTLKSVAKYSEDPNTVFAVYDCGENGIYARPLEMFLSEVDREKYPNIEQKYRFELI